MAYARHQARLRERGDDGATRLAHLEAAAARGHPQAIAALEGPEFPEGLYGLWLVFEKLHGSRGAGMHGPERLRMADIHAADALYGWGLAPHEVDALMMLDLVTLYPGED